MPKPREARGRRNKRKLDADAEDASAEQSAKRRRSDDVDPDQVAGDDAYAGETAAYPSEHTAAFFGTLDEQEQEYFKHADEMLGANAFADADERRLFVEAVHREAEGKQLKIAQSQSCSRLMEKLIAKSTPPQLKTLFQSFSGNFLHLITHRFASHCCEALFTYAAPMVSDELRAPDDLENGSGDPNQIHVSMENLFLHTLAELDGNVGFLMTDQYASHALRLLLLVFSGDPISTDAMKGLLQSKRKENVVINGLENKKTKGGDEAESKPRAVPKSFPKALEKLLTESIAGLDTDKLRALSTHPTANPTLQLLLRLELTLYGKQRAKEERSLIRTLLPDDPFTPDCPSAAFISGLVYDPVGAHLVERIIENAPAKLFKSLYHTFFKERLVSYARNEVATFVDCRILERLGYDDLLDAHQNIVPLISSLLEKSWTTLIRTLIERCTVRNIDTQAIAAQIDQTWRRLDRFDLERMLLLHQKAPTNHRDGPHTNGNTTARGASESDVPHRTGASDPSKVRMNVLAQAMLIVPGSLSALILDSLVELDPASLRAIAQDHITSRTLQAALTTKNASIIQRRKLIQQFYGHIAEMASDSAASHLVDCIWEGTHGLAFIRERIAEELAENEAQLRELACGRAVWKNWKMDLYKRRRADWVRQSKMKASNDGFQSFSELDAEKDGGAKKTPLEIARERHAEKKAKKAKSSSSSSGGAGSKMSSRKGSSASGPAPPVTAASTPA